MENLAEKPKEVNDDQIDRIFGPLEESLNKLLKLAEGFEKITPPTYAEFHYGKAVTCDDCDGDGYTMFSCCGDSLKGSDTYMCPTCHEHCGDEKEPCETCKGVSNV